MILTPWTPPAWMKTNGSRVHGGSLWAEYICRYVSHCVDGGMDVRLLSVQNEPRRSP
jgi:glucosylceramidase